MQPLFHPAFPSSPDVGEFRTVTAVVKSGLQAPPVVEGISYRKAELDRLPVLRMRPCLVRPYRLVPHVHSGELRSIVSIGVGCRKKHLSPTGCCSGSTAEGRPYTETRRTDFAHSTDLSPTVAAVPGITTSPCRRPCSGIPFSRERTVHTLRFFLFLMKDRPAIIRAGRGFRLSLHCMKVTRTTGRRPFRPSVRQTGKQPVPSSAVLHATVHGSRHPCGAGGGNPVSIRM